MDNRSDIREFLTTRRARITPGQAGLPVYGGNRRVPGLRRGELASLAGVSVEYYTRLEQGKLGGVSESILEALARALQLDEAERSHLFDLAKAAGTMSRPRAAGAAQSAVHPRCDHGRTRVRAQWPPGHPGRQPARARPVFGDVPRSGPASEPSS